MESELIVDEQGRLTLESIGVTFWIRRPEIDALATIAPQPVEIEQYLALHDQLSMAVHANERVSRRVVVTNPTWCPAYLQVLRGRSKNTLIAAFRSMDNARLPSDLGFLSREAQAFGLDQVIVSIGSLHTVLLGGMD